MADPATIQQSNIFGDTTTTSSSVPAEPASSATTIAGKVIDHLKFVADQAVNSAANRANWLAIAANAGQNAGPGSFVKNELTKPADLTRDKSLGVKLVLPDISAASLNLPALPDRLQVNADKIASAFKDDLDQLKNTWMAKYLPDTTDVSKLNSLIDNAIGGTNQTAFSDKLKAIEDDAKAALTTTTGKILALVDPTLSSSLTTKQLTDLAANLATLRSSIDANLTTAKTNLDTNIANLKTAIDTNKSTATSALDANLATLKGAVDAYLQTAKSNLDASFTALDTSRNTDLSAARTSLTTSIATLKTATASNLATTKATLDANMAALNDALNNGNLATLKQRLADNLATLKANLVGSIASLKSAVDANLTTAKANLSAALTIAKGNIATNFTSGRAGVDAAVALAKDNTQNVAWNRGRDQAAREAARLEKEAVSRWASRGFSLPGGALLAEIQKAKQASLNAASDFAAVQAEKVSQAFIELARVSVETWIRQLDAQVNADIRYLEAQNAADLRVLEAKDTADLRLTELQDDADLRVLTERDAADLRTLELSNEASLRAAQLKAEEDERVLELQNAVDRSAAELGMNADVKVLENKDAFGLKRLELKNSGDMRALELKQAGDSRALEAKDNADLKVLELKDAADSKVADSRNAADLRVLEAKDTADLEAMRARDGAAVQAYKVFTDAGIEVSKLEYDATRQRAKNAIESLGLTLDFTKFAAGEAVRYRLGVLQAMDDLIRAYATARSGEIDRLNAISKSQMDMQNAVLDYFKTALAAAEVGMRVDVKNMDRDIQWATIAAQFIGTAVGHHVTAAATAADVFSRVAGMALGGLNGISQVTSSGE